MKLALGFSPCPNDTFIFDALVNKKVESGDLKFEVVLEDVETLNKWAAEGKLHVSKMSFPALFQNADKYSILSAGSALGKGVGPLLIAKNKVNISEVENYTIAIPGENTTANFLLNFAFPFAKNKTSLLFSEIENAVLNDEFDLGVIIHENRFTYQQRGLIKICDLGQIWEEKQKVPIPLGCIAIKKDIDKEIQYKIDRLIKESLEFAFKNYPVLPQYVKEISGAMDESVMRKHIDLYVNDFSLNLGSEGKKAIEELYRVYSLQSGIAYKARQIFAGRV